MSGAAVPDFPRLLQDFFLQRLIAQRGASQRTITSYRDAFELLLRFAEQRTGHPASTLSLNDLDAPLILDFLDHLEQERGNSRRTRNARLTAIRSFMRYASLRDPTALPVVQRVLAIPAKRFDRPVLGFLSRDEIQTVLDVPDLSTWSGHRDAVLLMTLYNSGARVSEITALCVADVLLERRVALLLHGKGRKERVVPLWPTTAKKLRAWLDRVDRRPNGPVFPNRAGKSLSRSGVRQRLERAVAKATERCPSLAGRRVSPHTLRHTTAMHLLQSGVDLTVIALLLGHEDPSTTHKYLEADLAMKEAALGRLQEPSTSEARFRPSQRMLAFLDTL
jgi:site-specific recombinase XerD